MGEIYQLKMIFKCGQSRALQKDGSRSSAILWYVDPINRDDCWICQHLHDKINACMIGLSAESLCQLAPNAILLRLRDGTFRIAILFVCIRHSACVSSNHPFSTTSATIRSWPYMTYYEIKRLPHLYPSSSRRKFVASHPHILIIPRLAHDWQPTLSSPCGPAWR